MVDNSWAFEITDKLFAIVSYKAKKKLSTKYPNIMFTQSDSNELSDSFPCVFFDALSSNEYGQTTECDTIESVGVAFQIEVYSDTTQEDSYNVMSTILQIFKHKKFTITQMPIFDNQSTVYRTIARVSRKYCKDDTL